MYKWGRGAEGRGWLPHRRRHLCHSQWQWQWHRMMNVLIKLEPKQHTKSCCQFMGGGRGRVCCAPLFIRNAILGNWCGCQQLLATACTHNKQQQQKPPHSPKARRINIHCKFLPIKSGVTRRHGGRWLRGWRGRGGGSSSIDKLIKSNRTFAY